MISATSDQIIINVNGANYSFEDDYDFEFLFELDQDSNDEDCNYFIKSHSPAKKSKIITPHLTAVLDRAKISNRQAAMIVAAVLHTTDVKFDEISLSTSTVRRFRDKNREAMVTALDKYAEKDDSKLILQWDGKQMINPSDTLSKIDRLPVLVSSIVGERLLGAPKLEHSTAPDLCDAMLALMKKNKLDADRFAGMVFDTTSVNTGVKNGTCLLLQKALKKKLLHFACRHHIYELPLRAAFEQWMKEKSTGPNVSIFVKFMKHWNSIDKSQFSTGVSDERILQAIQPYKVKIIQLCTNMLQVINFLVSINTSFRILLLHRLILTNYITGK